MKANTYHVQADWDAEANVWVATSSDVPGLATEAGTIEDLTTRLRAMIPELLEANGLLPGNGAEPPVLKLLRGSARGASAEAHRRHLSRKYFRQ